jgi:GPH family glycoside/pentoside/hexuronide:cation symporter
MAKREYSVGKVPVLEKIAFSIGGMCNDLMGNAIMVLAMPILTVGFGLNASLVGLAIGIPRFFDAILDPVMGNISDNTRTRFGRRRPYIFAGSLIGGVLFALLWRISPAWSQMQMIWYFGVIAFLFFVAYSVFIVPYNGLASELTMDVDDRTRVMAYRAFFGSVAGLITPWAYKLCFVKALGETELEAVKNVGIIFGVLIIITGLIPALVSIENPAAQEQPKIKLLRSVRESMTNRPFLLLVGMVFLILMGLYLIMPMQLYLGIYYLFGGDKSAAAQMGGIAGTLYAIISLLATPMVAWLGTHFGKVRVLLWAQGTLICGSLLSWFLYTPANPYLSLICMGLMSPAMACVWILLGSMLADVCDYDEVSTGLRREGMYGAIYAFICKAGVASVLAVSGFLVNWAGYDASLKLQSEHCILWMRIMFAVVPALFAAFAVICTKAYPLSEQRMHEVRLELNSRKIRNEIKGLEVRNN